MGSNLEYGKVESQATSTPQDESRNETLELQGGSVTVREFRYRETLKAERFARPIVEQLKELLDKDRLDMRGFEVILAEHADSWLQLLSLATDRDIEWLEALSDTDGFCLMMAFWRVNGGIFMRRLIMAGSLSFSPSDLWGRFLPGGEARLQ